MLLNKVLANATYFYNKKIYNFNGTIYSPLNHFGVMAFEKLDDDPNAGILLSVSSSFEEIQDVTRIVLQECTNGVCEGVDGYVKYGTNSAFLGKCTFGACVPNENLDIYSGCTEDNDVGMANYDNKVLKICTTVDGTTYQFETVTPWKDNFLGMTVDPPAEYFRYVFDSTGNALAISNKSEGYYVIKDNLIITEVGPQSDSTLLLCTKANGCIEQSTVGYFFNAGNPLDVPFIKCTSASTCEVMTTPSTFGYFLIFPNILLKCEKKECLKVDPVKDGYYVDITTITHDNKYTGLIKYSDNSFSFISDPKVGYYINAIPNESDPLKEALIHCEINEEIVKCSLVTESISPNSMFINNDDDNLIQCYHNIDTSIKECSGIIGTGTTEIASYYINADISLSTTFTHRIIQCKGSETCILMDSEKNSVYINGNYMDEENNPNGDINHSLIFCYLDNNNNASCKVDVGTPNAYYVNQGEITSVTSYENLLIHCDNKSECKLANGGEDNIYLNGNKNIDNDYLIICNNNGERNECKTESGKTTDEKTDYYLNSDPFNTNPLKNSLIQCDNTECKTKDITSSLTEKEKEFYYINKNYGNDPENYLIRCYYAQNSNCELYHNLNSSINVIEHYVHGSSDTEHPTNKAIIEVRIVSNTEGNTPNILAMAEIKDATINDIYINSSNKNLIRCLSEGCSDYIDEWKDNIPKYYVNAASSFEDNYQELLIKCTESQHCELENGQSNGVYLNSNFGINGDHDHPLIICFEEDDVPNNKKCIQEKVTMESTDYKLFYKNYGEYKDDNNKIYSIITCHPHETLGIHCEANKVNINKGTSSDVFYINANKDHDQNYLIHCSDESSCEIYHHPSSVDGINEYYVHGAPDEENKLNHAIIQCNGIKENISVSCHYLDTVADNYIYVNSEDGNLIRCSDSNGCLTSMNIGTATEAIPSYFINGKGIIDDGSEKLLIECKGNGKCTEYIPKSTDTLIKYFIDGDNTNKLLICTENQCKSSDHANSYDSEKIITCSEEKCQSGGEVTSSIKTYAYYIHGANTKEIIQCDNDICEIQSFIYTQGHGYIDGADVNNKSVITCDEEDGCTSIPGSTTLTQVYIQAGSNHSLLIYCAEDSHICDTSSSLCVDECKLIKSETEMKYYIDARNTKNIISCDGNDNICSSNDSGASSSFIVKKKDGITPKRTIKCNENGCITRGLYFDILIFLYFYLHYKNLFYFFFFLIFFYFI